MPARSSKIAYTNFDFFDYSIELLLISGKSCIFVAKTNTDMKYNPFRAAIVAVVTLFSFASHAQDIIVTTDARKIEAKITEVSKSEIRYKEADNPDGPTFVLEVADISTIIYANGKVVLYTQPPTQPESQSAEPRAAVAPSTPPVPKQLQTDVQVTQKVAPARVVTDEALADILLLSGQTIRAYIVDMKSGYVTYAIDGNESTIPASKIEKVTFVQSGQVKLYNTSAASVVKKKLTVKA